MRFPSASVKSVETLPSIVVIRYLPSGRRSATGSSTTGTNGVTVRSMDELLDFLHEHEIDVAVLTVPADAAVAVAKLLRDNGIGAIWNFTNVELTEPNSSTIVENIHFSDSLLSLGYYVAERYDEEAAHAARLARREQ